MSPARRLVVVAAVLAAAAVAAAADLTAGPDVRAAARFHEVTGGIGAGPGLDFSGCGAAFDPRVEDVCEDHVEPVPGCDLLCPARGRHHAEIR